MRYFPVVGMIVACVVSGIYLISFSLWSQPIAVLVSTSCGIYLTGALHEDGFCDVCDGFGGGATKDQVLAIMKDSRIGAFGTIGISLLLAVKCIGLTQLPSGAVIGCLCVAHTVSRLASTALVWRCSYVRSEGKSSMLIGDMSTRAFVFACSISALVVVAFGLSKLLSWTSLVGGIATSATVSVLLTRMFIGRIGGYTGDCLGALQQVAEVAFYLGALASMTSL